MQPVTERWVVICVLLCSASCLPCLLALGEVLTCPDGQYFDAMSSLCQPCPAGQYSVASDAGPVTSCTLCPNNTYSSSEGSTFCIACPWGIYSLEGSTTCAVIRDCSRTPCSAYATCTDTNPVGNGYSCTCMGCYSGNGFKPQLIMPTNDGCFLPPFPGFGPGIATYPTANPLKAGDSIRFKFTCDCSTGPDIFRSPYPRFALLPVGFRCSSLITAPTPGTGQAGNISHAPGLSEPIPLPPKSWSWDSKTLEYTFKVGTSKAWARCCLLLELGFKQDTWRPEDGADATAVFQL